MYDYNTLVTALSDYDPGMSGVISNIARLQCPSILGQIALIYNASPAFAWIVASDFTGYNRISISYIWLCLHYLISSPSYKSGTVKSLRSIRSRKITIIIVIIGRWIGRPFVIPVCHCLAQTFSCGIIPAAAPYIKGFSNRLQCAKQIVLNGLGTCIGTWSRFILFLAQANTRTWKFIFYAINGLDTSIHGAWCLIKVVLGSFILILYPARGHGACTAVEIICNIIDLLKANRHNTVGGGGGSTLEIALHTRRACQPASCHNSGLGEISGISLAVLYKASGCNSWLRIEIIGLTSQLQPFRLHITGRRGKITSLSFRIGKPACYHNTSFACEVTFSSLAVFQPAFHLNTVGFLKVVFLAVQC